MNPKKRCFLSDDRYISIKFYVVKILINPTSEKCEIHYDDDDEVLIVLVNQKWINMRKVMAQGVCVRVIDVIINSFDESVDPSFRLFQIL